MKRRFPKEQKLKLKGLKEPKSNCAYCGKKATTRDHVPPVSFFPKPRTNDLITVPCCKSCNTTFGLDDEYVKTIVSLRDDIGRHPEGKKLVESVIRALGRKESQGFKSHLSGSLLNAEIKSESGLFLGYHDIHTVDKGRLKSFVERVARGLFFHVFKQPVPNDYVVTPAPFLEWKIDTLKMFTGSINNSNIRSISDGIFRFGWTEAPDSPMSTIWYMEFFNIVPFGVLIRNSNDPNH